MVTFVIFQVTTVVTFGYFLSYQGGNLENKLMLGNLKLASAEKKLPRVTTKLPP